MAIYGVRNDAKGSSKQPEVRTVRTLEVSDLPRKETGVVRDHGPEKITLKVRNPC